MRLRRSSVGVVSGPTFTPMGLRMPRKNSTWAPSSALVRTPIHGKWVVRSYQPCRRFRIAGLGLFIGKVQALVARKEIDPSRLVDGLSSEALEEVETIRDRLDQSMVLVGQRRMADPVQVPVLGVMQVGKAAINE